MSVGVKKPNGVCGAAQAALIAASMCTSTFAAGLPGVTREGPSRFTFSNGKSVEFQKAYDQAKSRKRGSAASASGSGASKKRGRTAKGTAVGAEDNEEEGSTFDFTALLTKDDESFTVVFEESRKSKIPLFKGKKLGEVHIEEGPHPTYLWFELKEESDEDDEDTNPMAKLMGGGAHSNDGRYYVFEDGTFTPSAGSNWEKTSARIIQAGNEKILVESFGGKSGDYTFVSKIQASPKALEGKAEEPKGSWVLDDHFIPINSKTATVSGDELILENVPLKILLKDWCKLATLETTEEATIAGLHHPSEEFAVLSCEKRRESTKTGTWVTRLRDGTSLQIRNSALTRLESKYFQKALQSRFEGTGMSLEVKSSSNLKAKKDFLLKHGMLKILELGRTIDLWQFDDEIRIQNEINPRIFEEDEDYETDSTSEVVSEVDELADYPDLVEQARKSPGDFFELSSEIDKQGLRTALTQRRSAVVLGDSGSGLTSTVRAFARDVALGLVPGLPRTTEIREITVSNILKGEGTVGTSETRVAKLVEWAKHRNLIYFIDRIETLRGTGAHSRSTVDATQWFNGPLSNGLRIVGTSVTEQFEKAFAHDDGFRSKFDRINHEAPRGEFLTAVLSSKIHSMGAFVSSARVFERAAQLSSQLGAKFIQPQAATTLLTTCLGADCKGKTLTEADLEKGATRLYGPNLFALQNDEVKARLAQLRVDLDEEVEGQEKAKDALINLLRRRLTGVKDARNIESILFVGPPGVGKSSISSLAAEKMGYKHQVIEMNQFAEGGVELFRRLVGKALRRESQTFLVLDEFEKANTLVQDAALRMLQEGVFEVQEQDPNGAILTKLVNARNATFLLTSNAAGDWIGEEWSHKRTILDHELREQVVRGGITRQIVSRVFDVIAMGGPNEKQFRSALVRAINKALLEQTKNYLTRQPAGTEVRFELAQAEGFFRECVKSHSTSTDYRSVRRIVQILENDIAVAILESSGQPVIHVKWNQEAIKALRAVKSYDGYI